MNLTGKEKKTQLYFRDDNKFVFRKLELEFSCLLEKKGKELKRAWKHFYGGQLYFPGTKKISADAVTLGFARDIILDPFDKIKEGKLLGEKPKNNETKDWIAQIAENQRHTYRSNPKATNTNEYINYTIMGVIMIMILGWIIRFLR